MDIRYGVEHDRVRSRLHLLGKMGIKMARSDRDRAIIGSLLAILFIASLGVGIPRAASPSSTTTPVLGAQKLAVITVQFPDATHDASVFDAQRAFSILDQYYRLNSYGKMWWDVSISPNSKNPRTRKKTHEDTRRHPAQIIHDRRLAHGVIRTAMRNQ